MFQVYPFPAVKYMSSPAANKNTWDSIFYVLFVVVFYVPNSRNIAKQPHINPKSKYDSFLFTQNFVAIKNMYK